VPDVLVGLQTGLVDVVYAPPSGVISLQWFTKTKYYDRRKPDLPDRGPGYEEKRIS